MLTNAAALVGAQDHENAVLAMSSSIEGTKQMQ